MRAMLECGYDINEHDLHHQNSLMFAIINKANKIVHLLLNNGAQVNSKNSAKYTPLIFAAHVANYEVVPALIARGAKLEVKCKADGRSLLGQCFACPEYHQGFKQMIATLFKASFPGGFIRMVSHVEASKKGYPTELLKLICEFAYTIPTHG